MGHRPSIRRSIHSHRTPMAINPLLATVIKAGQPYYRLTSRNFLTKSARQHRKVVNGQGAVNNPNGSRYCPPVACAVYLTEDVATCLAEAMFYFHREVLTKLDAQH